MNNQFSHINTYARKPSTLAKGKAWSVGDIAKEAGRNPAHSPHVINPQEPTQIAGNFPIQELELRLENYLDENKKTVHLKNGKTAQKKANKDAHVLVSSVYSWPEHIDAFDEEKAQAFFEDCLAFHGQNLGEVQCAVVHYDESFPHLHVYSFSNDARSIHPGWKAKKEAKKAGLSEGEANKIYKETMRQFQDDFFVQVGQKHGLDRLGPARQRLSRKEWQEKKKAMAVTAESMQKLQDELAQKQRALDGVMSKGRELTKAKKLLEKETQKMSREFEKLTQDVNASTVEIGKLSQDKEELQKTIEQMKKKEKIFMQAGGVFGAIRRGFYAVIGRDTPEMERLRLDMEAAQEKREEMRKKVSSVVRKKDLAQGQLTHVQSELNKANKRIKEVEAERKIDLEIHREELAKLEKEIERLDPNKNNPDKPQNSGFVTPKM